MAKQHLAAALLMAALLAPTPALTAPGAPAEPAEPKLRADALWTDWKAINRQSIQAETQARAAPTPSVRRRSQAEASALGARVGEAVAIGDCAEGERLAREAADFALVEAVRAHCAPPKP